MWRGVTAMYILNLNKSDLKWLQKGLDKKNFREYCKTILIHNGYAYATNGHVIHRIKVAHDELEGIYNYEGVKLNTDNEQLVHPLTRKELVENGYCLDVTLSIAPKKLNILNTTIEGKGVNKTYFNNAVDFANEIVVLTNDAQESIRIDYDNRSAIIMLINKPIKE